MLKLKRLEKGHSQGLIEALQYTSSFLYVIGGSCYVVSGVVKPLYIQFLLAYAEELHV